MSTFAKSFRDEVARLSRKEAKAAGRADPQTRRRHPLRFLSFASFTPSR